MSVFSRALLVSLAFAGFFSAASTTSTASAADGCVELTIDSSLLPQPISTSKLLCQCVPSDDFWDDLTVTFGSDLVVVLETCRLDPPVG
jgi:hypothetical protein